MAIRSETAKISSIRWPTNIIATPRVRSWSITANSFSTSPMVSAAVGSSRISTFASAANALAISTICCSDVRRLDTSAPASRRRPSTSIHFCASARILP